MQFDDLVRLECLFEFRIVLQRQKQAYQIIGAVRACGEVGVALALVEDQHGTPIDTDSALYLLYDVPQNVGRVAT